MAGFAAAAVLGMAAPANAASTAPKGAFGVGRFSVTFVDSSRATPANGSYPGAPTRPATVSAAWTSSYGRVLVVGSGD